MHSAASVRNAHRVPRSSAVSPAAMSPLTTPSHLAAAAMPDDEPDDVLHLFVHRVPEKFGRLSESWNSFAAR
ncbi:hypothetical protein [Streptomyces thioluteus]|uniref:hypothetical protein n=1 Tax=Streptomyces thioluteus TaxID=66431 RepID=UPI0031EFA4AD